jgi:hypothetical protein
MEVKMVKSQKAASALLISTKENAGILNKTLKQLGHEPPRVQTGSDWSLKRFIEADLKNFTAQSYIVLDVSAIAEQGDELIVRLRELQQNHELAVLIIYCVGLELSNLFLNQLVQTGFTNIIADYPDVSASKNHELIQADLLESFDSGLSAQKYSRFVLHEEHDTREFSADFDRFRIVAVFGSQRRIGVTTLAMSMCRYVTENGGNAALILCCSDAEQELQQMREYFDSPDQSSNTIDNIDVFTNKTAVEVSSYNLVVYDCGSVRHNAALVSEFANADMVFLCCGIGWKELRLVAASHSYLNGSEYTAVVNEPPEVCALYHDTLGGNLNGYASADFRNSDSAGELVYST